MAHETETLKILLKIQDMIEYAYPALKQYPKSERYAMVEDMKKSMNEMLHLAIRAEKKYYKTNTLQDLDVGLAFLRKEVELSYKLGFLPEKKRNVMFDYLTEIGKMLGGWIKSCGSKEKK